MVKYSPLPQGTPKGFCLIVYPELSPSTEIHDYGLWIMDYGLWIMENKYAINFLLNLICN